MYGSRFVLIKTKNNLQVCLIYKAFWLGCTYGIIVILKSIKKIKGKDVILLTDR